MALQDSLPAAGQRNTSEIGTDGVGLSARTSALAGQCGLRRWQPRYHCATYQTRPAPTEHRSANTAIFVVRLGGRRPRTLEMPPRPRATAATARSGGTRIPVSCPASNFPTAPELATAKPQESQPTKDVTTTGDARGRRTGGPCLGYMNSRNPRAHAAQANFGPTQPAVVLRTSHGGLIASAWCASRGLAAGTGKARQAGNGGRGGAPHRP